MDEYQDWQYNDQTLQQQQQQEQEEQSVDLVDDDVEQTDDHPHEQQQQQHEEEELGQKQDGDGEGDVVDQVELVEDNDNQQQQHEHSEQFGETDDQQQHHGRYLPGEEEEEDNAPRSNIDYPSKRSRLSVHQSRDQDSAKSLEEWYGDFVKYFGLDATVSSVFKEVAAMRQDANSHLEVVEGYKQRESMMLVQLSEKDQQSMRLEKYVAELQAELFRLQCQSLHTLHLDPCVQDEITNLKSQVETLGKRLKDAEEETQAVQYSKDGIIGKKLKSRCRLLAEENKELGRERYEGRTEQMTREMTLYKKHIAMLRRDYKDALEVISQLTKELDKSQDAIERVTSANTNAGKPENRTSYEQQHNNNNSNNSSHGHNQGGGGSAMGSASKMASRGRLGHDTRRHKFN